MDITRALRLLMNLREADQSAGVTKRLSNLRQQMDQLVSNPTDSNSQIAVSEAARELREAITLAAAHFTPEELASSRDLTKIDLFDPELALGFERSLAENVATPAVARDFLATAEQTRTSVLNLIQTIIASGKDLGWDTEEGAKPWEAEVGFKIPREIFANEFDRLIGELRFLRRFLSNIAEVEGEALADVQLSSLSTTDPLIVLGVVTVIAERLGKLTKWALDCWKTVEEIRKIREETRKLRSFSEEEVETIFGDKIRAEIDSAIQEKAKELASRIEDAGRSHELENALSLHLKEFLGRIERGMTVEIRLLSAPSDDDEEALVQADNFDNVASSLVFPPRSPNPVLQISQQDGS